MCYAMYVHVCCTLWPLWHPDVESPSPPSMPSSRNCPSSSEMCLALFSCHRQGAAIRRHSTATGSSSFSAVLGFSALAQTHMGAAFSYQLAGFNSLGGGI